MYIGVRGAELKLLTNDEVFSMSLSEFTTTT